MFQGGMAGGETHRDAKTEKAPVKLHATRIHDLDEGDVTKIRGLKNAIKKRHLMDLKRDSMHDRKIFSEERNGAMFTVGGAEMKGFLGLIIDPEKGTAQIRSLRADNMNSDVIRELVHEAMAYLRDKNVHAVSVMVSDELQANEVVLKELKFERTGEEDGRRILEAPVH